MNTLANIPQLRIDDENPDLSTVAQAGQSIAEAVDFMQQFRQNLYNFFPYRADALMELIDALASNTTARSVVELSLSPLFRREYSSVYDAIENFFVATSPETAAQERRAQERRAQEQELVRLIAPVLPAPEA